MCRMGFVILDKHNDLAKEYAFRVLVNGILKGEYQGDDSTGVYFYYTDGSHYLLKDVLEPSEFLNQYYDELRKAFFKKDVRVAIFHDRLASAGPVDVRNAQPLRMGDLVVAHNGHIPVSIGKEFSDTYAFTSIISSVHGRSNNFSKFLKALKSKVEQYAYNGKLNLIIFSEKFRKLITVYDGDLDQYYVPELDVFFGLSDADEMYVNPKFATALEISETVMYRKYFYRVKKSERILWEKNKELDYPLDDLAVSTRGSLIYDVSSVPTEVEEFKVRIERKIVKHYYGYEEEEYEWRGAMKRWGYDF